MNIKSGYMVQGEGFPVVFLHCSMSRKEQWLSIFKSLKNKFKLIAIDLYGYGETPFPDKVKGFSLDDEIELMESVLDKETGTGENFHLVGHSYGGAVAMRYSTFPHRKNISLSVYEPMLNHVFRDLNMEMFDLGKEFIEGIEKDIALGDYDSGCRKFIDVFSGDGTFDKLPEEIKNLFRDCIKKMPLDYKATIADNLNLLSYRNMGIPVCLMYGNKSPEITSFISLELIKIIEDIEVHVVNGGHMAPIEKSDIVNGLICKFLDKFQSDKYR